MKGLGPEEVEWFCQMDEDGFADRRTLWTKAKEKLGLPEPVDELLAAYRSANLDLCKPDSAVLEALAHDSDREGLAYWNRHQWSNAASG